MYTDSLQFHDPRFRKLVFGNVHLEKLWTGGRWTEGPAYFPAGRYLVWSDIPNDRVMRLDETDGSVSTFMQPARHQNGHTVDRQGRLVCCEHEGRCVSRVEHDGATTILASHVDGRRLNSPNDVVVKSDDSVWFTDPTYGIDSEYEGSASPSETDGSHVYRIDPRDGRVHAVARDFHKPNGLAFSPDESLLYIADTGATHSEEGPRHIRVFRVGADGLTLDEGKIFASLDEGLFDGFRCDTAGNLWTSAHDGVRCYAPDGTLLGTVRVPEVVANLCFGGRKRNRLFICGTTSLYSIYVNAQGATWPR